MKKVLFTATVDSHIKQFHLPYLQWFKEQGYEVHVATNGKEEIPYCDKKHTISFERSPIKINNLKAIKQLKKIIEKEKFEIIHCHTPMGSVVTRLAARKARKKYHTRVIYTAHGFHFFKGAPLINWIIFYPVEFLLSNITDCLITINQEDYNLAKKRFKAKQIELVHGVGVDESKFNFEMSEKEKIELRKSLGLNEDDFVIIYVAELNKNKNQIMLLKTMKEIVKEYSNIKLLLVGKGKLREFLENNIKQNNLEQNVSLLGYRTDVPKLLKISDLYVSTSKREGLPLNIIEAMICNLPIIATNCRGNRDLGLDKSSIVKIDDYKELENKVKLLVRNTNKKIYKNNKYLLKEVLKDIIDKVYT